MAFPDLEWEPAKPRNTFPWASGRLLEDIDAGKLDAKSVFSKVVGWGSGTQVFYESSSGGPPEKWMVDIKPHLMLTYD